MQRLTVLAVVLGVTALSGVASATIIYPDAALGVESAADTPEQAVTLIGQFLTERGFRMTGRFRIRTDGFVRAEFRSSLGSEVAISGRAKCLKIGIYSARVATEGSDYTARTEARDLRDGLIRYVRSIPTPQLGLFEVSTDGDICGNAL